MITSLTNNWAIPDASLALGTDQIHIWKAPLDLDLRSLGTYLAYLSPEERQRARAYQRDQDRFRFLANRGFLREVLGRYLQMPPAQVVFKTGPQGKLFLDTSVHPQGIYFNSARSEGIGLMAFCRNHEVGVDLELLRDDVDFESISHHFFTLREQALVQSAEGVERLRLFYTCWTLKEALLKAKGVGIAGGLDKLDMTLPETFGPWRMQVLDIGSLHAGALIWSNQPPMPRANFKYFLAHPEQAYSS
jgi:4'-phosphopantetheinyl transferase